jgi:NAD(P)-dependent dehydrogenase (short-subunit alcohol dehydrogenase family)
MDQPTEPDLNRPATLFDLGGRAAIVTGASGAFGSMATKVLAAAGAHLLACAGTASSLEDLVTHGRSKGLSIAACNRRPDSAQSCDAIVEACVEAFGRVDILVSAAGKNDVAKIVDMDPSRFLDVMDVNVTQSWLIARAVARQMLKQGEGGKIILMSSARGLLGHPAGYTAYCASKSAIDGITKALGCELGPTGITVNAIGPTVFRSPLTAWMFEDTERSNEVRKGFLARVPKGRLGEPSDLAGPLIFLASRASDFYTGHVLYADGGYTAG